MADDQQTQQTEQVQGNQPEARNPDGSLKDQTSIQQSGDQKTEKTSSGDSQKENERSFLNREPEKKSEEKPSAAKEGEAKSTEGKAGDAPQGAPEKYADFTVPDGYKIDDETLKSATAVFKELNLPQEGAQKLVNLYADKFAAAAEAPYKLWADTQSGWVDKILSDFGEAKAESMRSEINKGIEAAFPPRLQRSFREAIDLTGAGSNPAMFEAFHTLFKPFIESQPVKGNGPAMEGQTAPKTDVRPSLAESMYPHLVGNRSE